MFAEPLGDEWDKEVRAGDGKEMTAMFEKMQISVFTQGFKFFLQEGRHD